MAQGLSHVIAQLITFLVAVAAVASLCYMAPERGFAGGSDPRVNTNQVGWNQKVPPQWNCEVKHHYTLRHYAGDIILWSMTTDLYPHQQVAAVINRLGGAARDVCRGLTMNEICTGAPIPSLGCASNRLLTFWPACKPNMDRCRKEQRLAFAHAIMGFRRARNESVEVIKPF